MWRKGFDNWTQAKNLDELKKYVHSENIAISSEPESDSEPLAHGTSESSDEDKKIDFSWDNVKDDDQIFVIKIGEDRGGSSREYGPYSLDMIGKLISQKRINHLTEIFTPGMQGWSLIGEIKFFENLLDNQIESIERRQHPRCPISAKFFLADSEKFFQGVCRDVSIGGAQVLVANFSGKVGDEIKLNMHMNDGSFAFTAKGKVTRSLHRVGGFAMRFIDLSPESIRLIDQYIESYEG